VQKVSSIVNADSTVTASTGTHSNRNTLLGMSGKGVLLGGAFGKGTSNTTGTNQSRLANQLSLPEQPNLDKGTTATTFYGPVLILVIVVAGLAASDAPRFLAIPVLITIVAGWFWLNVQLPGLRRQEFERENALWEDAKRVWDQLYYCYRCDGVFQTGTSGLKPVAEIHDLIFRNA
jgi:hypothetical protein